MNNGRFCKKGMIIIILLVIVGLFFGSIAGAQWYLCFGVWPQTLCHLYPSFYTEYGYFNSINGYLLGFAPFTPFLTHDVSAHYDLAGIPTYPYTGSPYLATFPYQTLPETIMPYARFDYPSYVYGPADFYLNWVLMQ